MTKNVNVNIWEEIFKNETNRINKTIRKINKHGFNIKEAEQWKVWFDKNITESNEFAISKEALQNYRKSYLKYLDDLALDLIKNIDLEKAEEAIENENAEYTLDKYRFRKNGFLQYIKSNIWNVDLTKSEDELLNIFILEWYDLSEIERRKYRKLAVASVNRYYKDHGHMKKDGHHLANFMDIDICWDSEEEWED